MATDLGKLTGIVSGVEIPPQEVKRLAKAWTQHQLQAGETLWKQGEPASSLGLLVKGELQVVVGGQDIGTVLPGQVFGEATAFSPSSVRSATLLAVFPSEVLLIDKADLAWLRSGVPSFYDRMLSLSLEAMARRVALTDRVISNLSAGKARNPTRGIGTVQSLWRTARRMGSIGKPDLLPLLQSLPQLGGASEEILHEIAAVFQDEPFERGQVVVKEGEQADSVILVGSGMIRASKRVHDVSAEELVVFKKGDLLGIVALVSPGERTVSCHGKEPGWLFTMNHRSYRNLSLPSRVVWKECLATLLGLQLRIANELVARALGGVGTGPIGGDDLSHLAEAAGALVGSSKGR